MCFVLPFDSIVNREIGLRLRKLREEKNLSREQLAEAADISVQFLADIETGRKGMTVQTLRKLVLALRCSSDELVLGHSLASEQHLQTLPPALLHVTPQQVHLAGEILELVLKLVPPSQTTED